MAASGKRHPLLVYIRLYRFWRTPALLIAIGCGLLWWFMPPELNTLLIESSLLAATVLAALLFVYSSLGQRLSYVQCRPNHLRISTPLYRLAISYNRIRTSRPVLFETDVARPSRRWLGRPFSGRPAVALDLFGYPVSLPWLRLWLNEFVLPGSFQGLLLLTPDWMALNREIDDFQGKWKDKARAGARSQAITSMTPHQR